MSAARPRGRRNRVPGGRWRRLSPAYLVRGSTRLAHGVLNPRNPTNDTSTRFLIRTAAARVADISDGGVHEIPHHLLHSFGVRGGRGDGPNGRRRVEWRVGGHFVDQRASGRVAWLLLTLSGRIGTEGPDHGHLDKKDDARGRTADGGARRGVRESGNG